MYSSDYEKENGYSNSLVELKNDIEKADGLIISVNEHNGNLSAYFKNLIDWLSRLERRFLNEKPIFLMATSGGKRGGIGALENAQNIFPRFGGTVVCTFSLPSYKENFELNKGITNADLSKEHRKALDKFLTKI
jgi:NAD(P)H-dependent FMN reductase